MIEDTGAGAIFSNAPHWSSETVLWHSPVLRAPNPLSLAPASKARRKRRSRPREPPRPTLAADKCEQNRKPQTEAIAEGWGAFERMCIAVPHKSP
jgi:hypothetical protein